MYHCSSRDEICFRMWRRCDSSIWSSLIAGLIQLIWLARRGSLCCLMAPCSSFPKMHAWLKRTAFPNRRGPFFFFCLFFAQGYTNDCTPQLEPPKKLSRDVVYFFTIWTRTWLCNLLWLTESSGYDILSVHSVLDFCCCLWTSLGKHTEWWMTHD